MLIFPHFRHDLEEHTNVSKVPANTTDLGNLDILEGLKINISKKPTKINPNSALLRKTVLTTEKQNSPASSNCYIIVK